MRSGLGNRLRLILSAQAIADAERRHFYYHWPIGEERGKQFGARLDELWQYEGGIALDEPGPEPRIEFSQLGTGDLAAARAEPIMSIAGNTIVRGFGNERWWGNLLAELRPTEEVVSLATPLLKQLGSGFVGVQVRAHPTLTHEKTLAESPVSWFIDKMNKLKTERPDVAFFLSCDHPDAQQEVLRAIPDVVALPKVGDYNSRRGLIESVADLVILSRSELILEPYASTFANLAWLMARRKIAIENSVQIRPAQTANSTNSPDR